MANANILLVDDRPESLLVLEAVLAPFGENLVLARSADEALKHLLTVDFALILLDVQMPFLSGYDLARLIRSRERTRLVPIIFVTAINKEDGHVVQGYESGAVDYIFKPFNPDILRSKVSVFLELYHQRLQIQNQAEQLRLSELRDVERKAAEREQAAHNRIAKQAEARQEAFLKEVLSSVTGGKLRLCCRLSDLPKRARTARRVLLLTPPSAAKMRSLAQEVAGIRGFSAERGNDLATAVSEAVMNAIVHGAGGSGRVCVSQSGTIQVWIEDAGKGIDLIHLPRAMLERGYSTAGTLGHGFWLMLQLVDRVWIMSDHSGTTIVLEQDSVVSEPYWLEGRVTDTAVIGNYMRTGVLGSSVLSDPIQPSATSLR